jgi:hypothetical protein
MRRDGYIVVPTEHPLFPDKVARSMELRAQKIIAAIEKKHAVKLAPLAFEIHQQPKADRKPAMFAKALFAGKTNDKVRILLTDERLSNAGLAQHFSKLDLFISIEDGAASSRLLRGLVGGASCNIEVRAEKAARIVEDVIVDIALGTFFREHSPIKELIAQSGLEALFRQKAKFFKANLGDSWISEISRYATYAVLASLNKVDDNDVPGRAAAAYDAWLAFSRALSGRGLAASDPRPRKRERARPAPVATESPVLAGRALEDDLIDIPRLGGQLPIRRIIAMARTLPAGDYTLLVLRRSSAARKSPVTRGKIQALFGRRARRNTFRLFSSDRYLSTNEIIDDLLASGHIFLKHLKLGKPSDE